MKRAAYNWLVEFRRTREFYKWQECICTPMKKCRKLEVRIFKWCNPWLNTFGKYILVIILHKVVCGSLVVVTMVLFKLDHPQTVLSSLSMATQFEASLSCRVFEAYAFNSDGDNFNLRCLPDGGRRPVDARGDPVRLTIGRRRGHKRRWRLSIGWLSE